MCNVTAEVQAPVKYNSSSSEVDVNSENVFFCTGKKWIYTYTYIDFRALSSGVEGCDSGIWIQMYESYPQVCFWGNWIKHHRHNKWAGMLCPATVLLRSEDQGCPVQLRISPCLAVSTLQQLPAPWCWTQTCASKNSWKTCSYADRTAPSLVYLSSLFVRRHSISRLSMR